MEMSHRGKDMVGIAEKAEADLRELLGVRDDYAVLFLQGGATRAVRRGAAEPARRRPAADYVNTGQWSIKAIAEAQTVLQGQRGGELRGHALHQRAGAGPVAALPGAAYLHYTPNETIGGVEYGWVPRGRRDAAGRRHVLDHPVAPDRRATASA